MAVWTDNRKRQGHHREWPQISESESGDDSGASERRENEGQRVVAVTRTQFGLCLGSPSLN